MGDGGVRLDLMEPQVSPIDATPLHFGGERARLSFDRACDLPAATIRLFEDAATETGSGVGSAVVDGRTLGLGEVNASRAS